MTPILPADPAAIDRAGAILRRGGLVVFPTETVYGLGADAGDDRAVAALYAAKGRPAFNPLIAHVGSLMEAEREGRFAAAAYRLAEAFWPGPLTLVVPLAEGGRVCLLARAGLDSVALRVPAHSVARALLAAAGRAIVAPSANLSGRISPTAAPHAAAELDGRVDLILDAGPCPVGLESAIVSCIGEPTLLRPGGVTREAIEAALGRRLMEPEGQADRLLAPGQLASHYAPRAPVRLDATTAGAGEAVLDFAGRLATWRSGRPYRDLSPAGDLDEAAATLFAALRDLDAAAPATIAVAPVPPTGLGAAIRDRLARAAAPR